MKIQKIEGFEVVGFSVRTRNEDEMNPSTAKISALWNKFYSDASLKLTTESQVYGVYTNYESDYTGPFDVVACSNMLTTETLKESTKISIRSGKYLTFSAKGEMPKAVMDLWTEIWNYFNSPDCVHSRTYTTDFEHYKDADEIEISIAIL
jgi:predicted transcriptional regulator YdeE